MKIAFEFNDGETAAQIVSSIVGLFGIGTVVAPVATHGMTPALDAPDVGEGDGIPSDGAGLDTEGFPYDKRIHSDNPQKTDKGVWRKRRGADKTLVAQLQAAHKAGSVAQSAVAAPVAPPPANLTPPPVLTPPPAIAPPPALAPVAPVAGPFEKFVAFITANMQSPTNPTGRLTSDWVTGSLAHYEVKDAQGVGSLQALQHLAPERVTAIHSAFAQALGIPA